MLDWKREVQTVKFECRRIRQDDETSDIFKVEFLKILSRVLVRLRRGETSKRKSKSKQWINCFIFINAQTGNKQHYNIYKYFFGFSSPLLPFSSISFVASSSSASSPSNSSSVSFLK